MVLKEVVQEVHDNLKGLLDEARAHRESPTTIRILENLVRLTDLSFSESGQAEEEKQIAAPAVSLPAGTCENGEHKNLTVFGRCKDCGECTHPEGSVKNGVCLTCDQAVEETAG